MKEIERHYKLSKNSEDYLELWKWFTDDAARIKDRTWTMASFFYTALAGLLGFIINHITPENGGIIEGLDTHAFFVLFAAAIGLFASWYVKYMLEHHGEHIGRGWNRANYIRLRINGLSEIWHCGNQQAIFKEKFMTYDDFLPEFVRRLINFSYLFMFLYVLILITVLTRSIYPNL